MWHNLLYHKTQKANFRLVKKKRDEGTQFLFDRYFHLENQTYTINIKANIKMSTQMVLVF